MIFTVIFSLLSTVVTDAAAWSLPVLRRQQNVTADSNTFASITPSKTLAWVSCYEDSLAAQLGPVSCARLIVCRKFLPVPG